jgi:uncharacterized protein YecT (DUF1311 family)
VIILLLSAAMIQFDAGDCRHEGGSQRDLNECAYKQFVESDRALNQQWRRTSAMARRVDKELNRLQMKPALPRLVKGQRAWVTYRDETCGWVRDSNDGSMVPMLHYFCMADVTKARTEELRTLSMSPVRDGPR